ncbi:MAG: anthranilate synthase component I [Oligosphaeraceae bacterium]|nr:anthranilate synthase component I [Oligosphaeraceae bacterium]
MLKFDFEEFSRLSKDCDLVPVYAECLADLETPVSVLNRFVGDENVLLLESVEGGERVGRYSFIGVNPHGVFTIENRRAFYLENGVRRELPHQGNPLEALRQVLGKRKVAATPGLPPLFGGAIGFIGYEAAGYFEDLPKPKAPVQTPDCVFMLTDEIIVFDNLSHTLKVIICVRLEDYPSLEEAYRDAESRAEVLLKRIAVPSRLRPEPRPPVELPALESNMSQEEFCAMVAKGKQYIQAGEVIQVVLSHRFSAPAVSSPLQIYRALRLINPSPYTFFLKLGGLILAGSSPETMVKLEHGRSAVRPIAGTRKRGQTEIQDRALADELLNDEKERAEHLMLVDLGRNDLGRTAVPNSVQVKTFMNVERYSHVMHLVSDVEAVLAEPYDACDLIRTTFPAGTLSGAPKIRAMELIHELEAAPRGVYGGAVGYISYCGDLDLCITIRTIEMRDARLFIQVGAGIVYDSVPEKEYEETLNKAAALFQAVNLAAHNFRLA